MIDLHESPKLSAKQLKDTPRYATISTPDIADISFRQIFDDFRDYGYVILSPEIPGFDIIAKEIIQHLEPLCGRQALIQDAWQYDSGVRSLALSADIAELLKLLYGRSPIPFRTENFRQGPVQTPRSDTFKMQSRPRRWMCGVWFALEDSPDERATLRVYPASQKLRCFSAEGLGLLPGRSLYPLYEKAIQDIIEDYNLQAEEIHLKKGQAILWDANLLREGIAPEKDWQSKHGQLTRFTFTGCSCFLPGESDEQRGDLRRRELLDIRTGKPVIQFEDGNPVKMDIKDLLSSRAERFLLRHPQLSGLLQRFQSRPPQIP